LDALLSALVADGPVVADSCWRMLVLAVGVQLCMAVSCQRCDTKVYHQVCLEKFLKVRRANA
jgi:hypothetical protein